jgi:hypothetical protein
MARAFIDGTVNRQTPKASPHRANYTKQRHTLHERLNGWQGRELNDRHWTLPGAPFKRLA